MSASILAVDDSASLRMAIRIALTGAGYTVTEASDGVDGLTKANATRFDMIVTDLAIFRRPDHDSRFQLVELAPGVTADEVAAKTTAAYQVAL